MVISPQPFFQQFGLKVVSSVEVCSTTKARFHFTMSMFIVNVITRCLIGRVKELTGDKQVLALENSMVFSWNFLVMDKQMCQAVGNSISSLVVEWSSCVWS